MGVHWVAFIWNYQLSPALQFSVPPPISAIEPMAERLIQPISLSPEAAALAWLSPGPLLFA